MQMLRERLTGDNHEDYLRAVNDLAALPPNEAVSVLTEIADTHSGRIRSRILNPLLRYAPDQASRVAVRVLDSPDNKFHADALYILMTAESPLGCEQACRIVLSHPDSVTRLWATSYLGNCGAAVHIPVLEQALNDDGTDEEGRQVGKGARAAIAAIVARSEVKPRG